MRHIIVLGFALSALACMPPTPKPLAPAEAFAVLPTPEFVARAEKVWAMAERDGCESATPERTASAVRAVWSTPDDEMVDLVCRRIWVGMTRSQLVQSLGDPNTINETVGAWGRHEQWVYRSYHGYSATYVYVEGGKVTSYQSNQ